MKARNIIPGWPRGRSGTGQRVREVSLFDLVAPYVPVQSRQFYLRWYENKKDAEYHRAQQAMVDKYLHEPMLRAADTVRLAKVKIERMPHIRHLPRQYGNPEGIEVATLARLFYKYANFMIDQGMKPSPMFKKLVGRTA